MYIYVNDKYLISISMEHYLIKAISSIGAKLNLRRRHM